MSRFGPKMTMEPFTTDDGFGPTSLGVVEENERQQALYPAEIPSPLPNPTPNSSPQGFEDVKKMLLFYKDKLEYECLPEGLRDDPRNAIMGFRRSPKNLKFIPDRLKSGFTFMSLLMNEVDAINQPEKRQDCFELVFESASLSVKSQERYLDASLEVAPPEKVHLVCQYYSSASMDDKRIAKDRMKTTAAIFPHLSPRLQNDAELLSIALTHARNRPDRRICSMTSYEKACCPWKILFPRYKEEAINGAVFLKCLRKRPGTLFEIEGPTWDALTPREIDEFVRDFFVDPPVSEQLGLDFEEENVTDQKRIEYWEMFVSRIGSVQLGGNWSNWTDYVKFSQGMSIKSVKRRPGAR